MGAFQQSIDSRFAILLEKVRLLSGDFAFKQAVATRDHGTILSVLQNHQHRVGADIMLLLSFEDVSVVADTLHPKVYGQPFSQPHLVERAYQSDTGEAIGIEFIEGSAFQLVVVPLFTPEPSAWIVLGFAITDDFARNLKEATKTHVSLLYRNNTQQWTMFSSTLPLGLTSVLTRYLALHNPSTLQSFPIEVNRDHYISLLVEINESDKTPVIAVLQRSLNDAMEPYMGMRVSFVIIFGVGLLVASLGAEWIAHRVTKPVEALVKGADRIGQGDYSAVVDIPQRDEIGALACAFNKMSQGLKERERIASLLGKVVSPAIAEELQTKEIRLGGEEREVTILFSDVRNFTSLSENRSPSDILSLLNTYFAEISNVIDQHGGVVDKYIGDAVMALFGAPIRSANDAQNGVMAALAMVQSLQKLNQQWCHQGLPPLAVGIGLNTAKVVAGNIGSENRLNYTVIGDGVNLASRLEGITKRYGCQVVVSESTLRCCPDILFRELDRVRVKGKQQAVAIYEPLGLEVQVDAEQRHQLELYRRALHDYRCQRWSESRSVFSHLLQQDPGIFIYQLYLQRIEQYRHQQLPASWDATVSFSEK